MTSMTQAEKQAFIADPNVGVLALNTGDRGPLSVPMRYDYEPGGELWFLTDLQSLKGHPKVEWPICFYIAMENIDVFPNDHIDKYLELEQEIREYIETYKGA